MCVLHVALVVTCFALQRKAQEALPLQINARLETFQIATDAHHENVLSVLYITISVCNTYIYTYVYRHAFLFVSF
jgi:hypothetical protein